MSRLSLYAGLLFLVATNPAANAGGLDDLTWLVAETVASPADPVLDGSAVAVISYQGDWHVVYESDGDIYRRIRTDTGWLPVDIVTSGANTSTSPLLAEIDQVLHIAWLDDRSGHQELWTRQWEGTSWTVDECLSCDARETDEASMGGAGSLGVVAWVDEVGGVSSVFGRAFENGSWQAIVPISTHASGGIQPTVAVHEQTETLAVVWTDTRFGPSTLFMRQRFLGSWLSETQLVQLSGNSFNASLHPQPVCGDVVFPLFAVAFENDQSGSIEVYGTDTGAPPGAASPISVVDGTTSTQSRLSGMQRAQTGCTPFGSCTDFSYVTWRDEPALEFAQVPGGLGGSPLNTITLSTASFGPGAVFARGGSPLAELMVAWVELDGVPTLKARRATQLGCFEFDFVESPGKFLIAPEAIPANVFTLWETCGGEPAVGAPIDVNFDPALLPLLDPTQHVPIQAITTGSGQATVGVYGGGCSQAGTVRVACVVDPLIVYEGVASPDVDGNCIVDSGDLHYVTTNLGNADFCADLDGSGLVDETDVAIVEATLGDHCPTMAIDETLGPVAVAPRIEVAPNPARFRAVIRAAVPAAAQLKIVDVAGHVVRNLTQHARFGTTGEIEWDLRDHQGRRVASGLYFATVEGAGVELRSRIIVVQ